MLSLGGPHDGRTVIHVAHRAEVEGVEGWILRLWVGAWGSVLDLGNESAVLNEGVVFERH
jgi:hypothetical protein